MTMNSPRFIKTIIWTLGVFIASVSANAASLTFNKRNFVYSADKVLLKDVISAFGASQGLSISLEGLPDDQVSAKFNHKPDKFWDLITAAHSLHWYFDGTVIHLSLAGRAKTEVLAMTVDDYSRFIKSLKSLDAYDRRFPIRYDESAQAAVVTGPPKMVEFLVAVYDRFDATISAGSDFTVRVFPLSSALAADQSLSVGSETLKIPGIASIVRNVMGLESATAPPASESKRQYNQGLEPMVPERGERRAATNESKSENESPSVSVRSSSARKMAGPRVEADEATNSVLVRDRPSKMKGYADLIASLDRRRKLVEIEAMVVDVDQSALLEVGIDWKVQRGSTQVSGYPQGGEQLPGFGQVSSSSAVQIAAGQWAIMAGDAARNFMARLRIAESNGTAQSVSSPKILTLENNDAVIENTETAFIKVSGNQEANLFSVVAGASLKIKPTILFGEERNRIRLGLVLEDGSFSGVKIENVPVVQRSRVSTQAELYEGDTIIIGGVSNAKISSGGSGIPVLRDIPLVGRVFGTKSESNSNRQRMYILTPRVLAVDNLPKFNKSLEEVRKAMHPTPAVKATMQLDMGQ